MDRMMGRYLVIEGPDGSGKTETCRKLEQLGFKYVREPGATDFGEAMRSATLTKSCLPSSAMLAMFAARNELLNSTVLPALESGQSVASDRGVLSSYAYNVEDRKDLSLFSCLCDRIMPDNAEYIVLDISYDTYCARREPTAEDGQFELKNCSERAKFDALRARYRSAALMFGAKIIETDCLTVDQVLEKIL